VGRFQKPDLSALRKGTRSSLDCFMGLYVSNERNKARPDPYAWCSSLCFMGPVTPGVMPISGNAHARLRVDCFAPWRWNSLGMRGKPLRI
jgi:hypothetical protein